MARFRGEHCLLKFPPPYRTNGFSHNESKQANWAFEQMYTWPEQFYICVISCIIVTTCYSTSFTTQRERGLVMVAIMCLPCSDLHPSAQLFEACLSVCYLFILSLLFFCSSPPCSALWLACVCMCVSGCCSQALRWVVAFSSSGCGWPWSACSLHLSKTCARLWWRCRLECLHVLFSEELDPRGVSNGTGGKNHLESNWYFVYMLFWWFPCAVHFVLKPLWNRSVLKCVEWALQM